MNQDNNVSCRTQDFESLTLQGPSGYVAEGWLSDFSRSEVRFIRSRCGCFICIISSKNVLHQLLLIKHYVFLVQISRLVILD